MKAIGQYLKEAREEKNLTFEQIEKETKIMSVFLDALERDQIHLFINQENYNDMLDFYARYLGLNKRALVAQHKILKMHEQRGTDLVVKAQSDLKELIPALKLIKERQRISIDLLENNFGSYEIAKKIFDYLHKNEFIAKPLGSYDWILNNEKINEYLDSYQKGV